MLIDADRPDARDPHAAPVAVVARPLGMQTNNFAEYTAVALALRRALELGADEVELVLDSKLVVEQLAGRWKVRHPAIRPLVDEVQALLARFRRWSIRHEPRAANFAADALANLALDDPAAASAAERGAVAGGTAILAGFDAPNARPAGEPIGSVALGAACAVFDDERRILLVRHSYAGRKWGLPGGHGLPGEAPDVTARRELQEETGLKVEPTQLAGLYFDPHDRRLGPSLHFVFRVQPDGAMQPSPRSAEIEEVRFWPVVDLPARMSEFTRRRVRDAARRGTAYAVLEPGERD